MVVLSMALAAAALTGALSLSDAAAPEVATDWRTTLGGDVLMYPFRWDGGSLPPGSTHELQKSLEPRFSWLDEFYPELFSDGVLTTKGVEPSVFINPAELDRLRQVPGVKDASFQPELPVDLVVKQLDTRYGMPLRLLPMRDLSAWEIAGRSFTAEELSGGDAVAIVNQYFLHPTTVAKPTAGQDILLRIPKLRDLDGKRVADFTVGTDVALHVVGTASLPTRKLDWIYYHPYTSEEIKRFEQAYLHAPILWVPEKTWQAIYAQAAGSVPPLANNVTLTVADMSRLGSVMRALQEGFPEYTFVSVPTLKQEMIASNRIDLFYEAPDKLWAAGGAPSLAVPREFGQLLGVLSFLVAAVLVMGRMLTSASQRRREIGILKSLGARRRDILTMVLAEVTWLCWFGTSCGYIIVRSAGVFLELNNHVALIQVLRRSLIEYGLVLGLATSMSLLAALLPAWRMANQTTMEVLRGD